MNAPHGTGPEGLAPDSLAADYAGAGFGRSLPWGERPALILIDLLRAYFEPGAEFYMGSDACLLAAARVLATARTAGIPVLHTKVEYDPDGINGGLFGERAACGVLSYDYLVMAGTQGLRGRRVAAPTQVYPGWEGEIPPMAKPHEAAGERSRDGPDPGRAILGISAACLFR